MSSTSNAPRILIAGSLAARRVVVKREGRAASRSVVGTGRLGEMNARQKAEFDNTILLPYNIFCYMSPGMTPRETSFTPAAARTLVRLPSNIANTIRSKIDLLASNPAALTNNITALKGSEFSRLRVGDYRVIFTGDMVVLRIVKIGHRRDIYE